MVDDVLHLLPSFVQPRALEEADDLSREEANVLRSRDKSAQWSTFEKNHGLGPKPHDDRRSNNATSLGEICRMAFEHRLGENRRTIGVERHNELRRQLRMTIGNSGRTFPFLFLPRRLGTQYRAMSPAGTRAFPGLVLVFFTDVPQPLCLDMPWLGAAIKAGAMLLRRDASIAKTPARWLPQAALCLQRAVRSTLMRRDKRDVLHTIEMNRDK